MSPMKMWLIDDMAIPKYKPRVYTAEAQPQNSGGKLSEMRLKQNGYVAAKQISIKILGSKMVIKPEANACAMLAQLHRNENTIRPHFHGTQSAIMPINNEARAVMIVYVTPDNIPY